MGNGAETLALMQQAAVEAARAARDAGANAAAAHAENESPEWGARARRVMREYASAAKRVGGDTTFTSEEVRDFAAVVGLPPPPDARAWGAVFMRARKAGEITHAGYTTSKNKSRHVGIVSQWRWAK